MSLPPEEDTPGDACGRWSDLGFQDLNDDEAFFIWAYRCWQQDNAPPTLMETRLATLLRHDRLQALLGDIFKLFEVFGQDGAMCVHLQGYPLLTHREELLLAMLCEPPIALSGGPWDAPAAACRLQLARHKACLRNPAQLPRSGRDQLELKIARSMGSAWG